jgi:hypothetical protein
MTQPATPLDWAEFLGSWSPFALAVTPFLSNRELFNLATCSRKLLRLRYDLGRWDFQLDDDTYERFCAMRHSVPLCFEATEDFDFVTYLGSRLTVRMRTMRASVNALAGVHTLNLSHCPGIVDVSVLGGVHELNLCGCTGIRNVGALAGVIYIYCNLSNTFQYWIIFPIEDECILICWTTEFCCPTDSSGWNAWYL